MQSISSPGGAFYAAQTEEDDHRDIVILSADEPNLRWFQFVDELISLCQKLGTSAIITLGSMYDNVLHTDRVISGVASTQAKISVLLEYGINSISYSGPSAVHSIIQSEGSERGIDCISLWSHCPYYLQGTTHFGILSHLAAIISKLEKIQLDTTVLDANWDKLSKQIDKLISDNSELQSLIGDLRKKKLKGSASSLKGNIRSDEKVINLKDFLDPS
jgi:proteasome assembly chaperone (PAC2) family protein